MRVQESILPCRDAPSSATNTSNSNEERSAVSVITITTADGPALSLSTFNLEPGTEYQVTLQKIGEDGTPSGNAQSATFVLSNADGEGPPSYVPPSVEDEEAVPRPESPSRVSGMPKDSKAGPAVEAEVPAPTSGKPTSGGGIICGNFADDKATQTNLIVHGNFSNKDLFALFLAKK